MSEQVKHTPGPWSVRRANRMKYQICGNWYGEDTDLATTQMVLNTLPGEIFEQQNEANARLMAAAPELLAALEEAESMLLVAMNYDLRFCKSTREEIIANHPGMRVIHAAIAKAKGGA